MPINSSQITLLHEKIKANESIDDVLAEIPESNLLDTINGTLSYITRDLFNSVQLSAVHLAAQHGNLPALKSLARAGANFKLMSGNYGKNALHYAAGYNHPHIVDYLIAEMGIPVDIASVATPYYTGNNTTPLFECAVHGCIEAAERLIVHGTNVNYESLDGNNALSYLYRYGRGWCSKQIVARMDELLLQHGAIDKSLDAIPRFEECVRTFDLNIVPYIHLLESLRNKKIDDKALCALPIIDQYINTVSDCNMFKKGFKSISESLKKGVYDDQAFNEIFLLEEYIAFESRWHKVIASHLKRLYERKLEVTAYTKKSFDFTPAVFVNSPQHVASGIIASLTSNGVFAPIKPDPQNKGISDSNESLNSTHSNPPT